MADTYIGALVAIATGYPATHNEAGFAALTPWDTIGHVVSIGEGGIENSLIEVKNLATGMVEYRKGEGKGAVMPIAIAHVTGDDGQIAVKVLARSMDGEGSLRMTLDNGKILYRKGIFHNWKYNEATTDSIDGYTTNFAQNDVEITSAV